MNICFASKQQTAEDKPWFMGLPHDISSQEEKKTSQRDSDISGILHDYVLFFTAIKINSVNYRNEK